MNNTSSENPNISEFAEDPSVRDLYQLLQTAEKNAKESEKELHIQTDVLEALCREYVDIFFMDPKEDTSTPFIVHSHVLRKERRMARPYNETWQNYTSRFVHPDDRERVLTASTTETVLAALTENSEYIIEYRIIYSGETHHHQCTYFRTNSGRIIFAFRDIDAIVYKERERVRQVTLYSNIVANAGLGIWSIRYKDGESPRMSANEKMREVMGITDSSLSEEEIYLHWYNRIVGSELPSVQASVKEMRAGHFSENTYQWNHPTKGIIYNRCGGTADILPDGSMVLNGYHADVTDIVINEQKQKKALADALAAAEKANSAKTDFLNNMSHDIRTPMNAILGYAELMENHINEPEVLTDYLSKLKTSGDVLLTFINNILDISRIESGKEEISNTLFDLLDEKNTVVPIFDSIIVKNMISFSHKINIQHRYIYCDTTKIRQIWINLLSNAVKYTPKGGKIELFMEELPCEIPGHASFVCGVSDTGIGISESYLPHIFDLFSREHTTTESSVIGSGLGMPLVKKMVDLMGGKIEINSKVGQGTTVKVYLTHRYIDGPDDLQKHESIPNTGISAIHNKRLLLAEDNDLNAEITTEILTEEGFSIDRAKDGIEVIDMIRKAPVGYYSAILMDIQMPNMDGYRATALLRSFDQKEKSAIPIIAMTANAFDADKRMALASGMNAYISKPINRNQMISILYDILRN